jgi:hypothetical protein
VRAAIADVLDHRSLAAMRDMTETSGALTYEI